MSNLCTLHQVFVMPVQMHEHEQSVVNWMSLFFFKTLVISSLFSMPSLFACWNKKAVKHLVNFQIWILQSSSNLTITIHNNKRLVTIISVLFLFVFSCFFFPVGCCFCFVLLLLLLLLCVCVCFLFFVLFFVFNDYIDWLCLLWNKGFSSFERRVSILC